MVVICCGGSVPPCEHDRKEIESLIFFKKRLKKHLTDTQKGGIMNTDKKERC